MVAMITPNQHKCRGYHGDVNSGSLALFTVLRRTGGRVGPTAKAENIGAVFGVTFQLLLIS